jgi:hydrogenase 3 maturation protease
MPRRRKTPLRQKIKNSIMDNTLKKDLCDFLKDAERIAVVGIGQEYRWDDAAGIIVVEQLFEQFSGGSAPPLNLYDVEFETKYGKLRLYQGYETPESLTGSLRQFLPTHVLFIDAAQLAREPGTCELVPISEIQGEEISTHNVPLSLLGEFLQKDMGSEVMLLGIQPFSIGLGEKRTLSPPVERAVGLIAKVLEDVLR